MPFATEHVLAKAESECLAGMYKPLQRVNAHSMSEPPAGCCLSDWPIAGGKPTRIRKHRTCRTFDMLDWKQRRQAQMSTAHRRPTTADCGPCCIGLPSPLPARVRLACGSNVRKGQRRIVLTFTSSPALSPGLTGGEASNSSM